MCGIAGVIQFNQEQVQLSRLKAMTDCIAHRGPDGDGHWMSADGHIGLGHRRLSIIDLSHEADQPMHYMQRYTIVFNGEIYNYLELRENLVKKGYTFTTQGDTEVLMAMYHEFGETCLNQLDGMFAFVLYDAQSHSLFCARDRFGEKPFFYSYQKGQYFTFGSEMKCLWAGGATKVVNQHMMFNYLAYNVVENPFDLSETFFEGCRRLPHAHYIKIDLIQQRLTIQQYYNINWQAINHQISVEQACDKFAELFQTSVSRRLRSDVPVGSSLSGGLDSSAVVCVIDELKKGSAQRQDTFSAVFPGFKKDEKKYIDIVTAGIKVNPHFVTPKDEDLLRDFDALSWHQEEPFLSSSIYVQYCVMRLAKEQGVTVLLDGQGADEVLAGYHHFYYAYFNQLKKHNRKEYDIQRRSYFDLHSQNPINGVNKKGLPQYVKYHYPSWINWAKKKKLQFDQLMHGQFNPEFYQNNIRYLYNSIEEGHENLNHTLYQHSFVNGLQQLLRYADRNSMAHSREVRLPFLSHELVDFVFSLPAEFKINQGWTKWILRKSISVLPNEIAWRVDKIGYEPPQKSWMQDKNVQDKIRANREKLVQAGYLNKKVLQQSIAANDAHNLKNNTWKFLVAGNL